MRALLGFAVVTGLGILAGFAVFSVRANRQGPDDERWTARFPENPGDLVSTGRNPFFILEPGYTLRLADTMEELVITVLDETRMVDGVETRVVEERESEAGELIEVSRNFYAISRKTNAVYYFGEEVDVYSSGRLVGHEGAWEAGVDGARFGLMMPGLPLLGGRYYQEAAPGVAMDRAEIVSLTDSVNAPAGTFVDVLKTEESTPLEPGVLEYKYYGPGVGLLQDGSLRLVSFGQGG